MRALVHQYSGIILNFTPLSIQFHTVFPITPYTLVYPELCNMGRKKAIKGYIRIK